MADSGPGSGIQVDGGALRDFAQAVRSEVDGSLRTHMRDAYGVYAQGASFGRGWCGSPDVQRVQGHYAACLTAITEALAGYVDSAGAYASAAERVAQRYADADARASASAQDVDTAFSSAYQAALVARQVEAAREQRGEAR